MISKLNHILNGDSTKRGQLLEVKVNDPDNQLLLRLCGIGVALSAEARGRIIPCRPQMPKWTQTCDKSLSQMGFVPTTSRLWC